MTLLVSFHLRAERPWSHVESFGNGFLTFRKHFESCSTSGPNIEPFRSQCNMARRVCVLGYRGRSMSQWRRLNNFIRLFATFTAINARRCLRISDGINSIDGSRRMCARWTLLGRLHELSLLDSNGPTIRSVIYLKVFALFSSWKHSSSSPHFISRSSYLQTANIAMSRIIPTINKTHGRLNNSQIGLQNSEMPFRIVFHSGMCSYLNDF